MDESTLIKKCLKGNPKAQKLLFDRYSSKMLGVCLRYAKDTDQAYDFLQEGFIKVFTKLDKFKGDGSFEGWIRRIIVNTALDQLRKEIKLKKNKSLIFKEIFRNSNYLDAHCTTQDSALLISSSNFF